MADERWATFDCYGTRGRSLPDWPVSAEVPGALAEAHRRAWRLFALSNSDRDLIDSSLRAIGVPFAGAIVASEIGSYKPAHGHWRALYETTGARPGTGVLRIHGDLDRHL